MKINHSFQINSLLKIIPPSPLLKNDHLLDKMEDRVKHAVNNYDDVLIMWLKMVMMVMWFWDYFSSVDRGVVEFSGYDNSG
jgi:hypothetical protein